mmetsp:Transcript_52444/g.161448  ORF Transcript_52444/g.161448 Transcript_52444/m.161448 type:complete len:379 (-) Transcript_52444:2085-3221(-)
MKNARKAKTQKHCNLPAATKSCSEIGTTFTPVGEEGGTEGPRHALLLSAALRGQVGVRAWRRRKVRAPHAVRAVEDHRLPDALDDLLNAELAAAPQRVDRRAVLLKLLPQEPRPARVVRGARKGDDVAVLAAEAGRGDERLVQDVRQPSAVAQVHAEGHKGTAVRVRIRAEAEPHGFAEAVGAVTLRQGLRCVREGDHRGWWRHWRRSVVARRSRYGCGCGGCEAITQHKGQVVEEQRRVGDGGGGPVERHLLRDAREHHVGEPAAVGARRDERLRLHHVPELGELHELHRARPDLVALLDDLGRRQLPVVNMGDVAVELLLRDAELSRGADERGGEDPRDFAGLDGISRVEGGRVRGKVVGRVRRERAEEGRADDGV